MRTLAFISSSRSGQAWYMDFAIALLLFIFTLVVYLSYTSNFQKQEKGELNDLLTDAKAISSSLALPGYPYNWNNETVLRIGIADDQKINLTKLKYAKQLNYSFTKRNFATIYDYFVFFLNDKGEVLNINGICGIGTPLINVTYNIKSAYYYQDPSDSFLKDFMNQTFKADIYFGNDGDDINDIDGLISNLSKYGLLVIEHPAFDTGKYGNCRCRSCGHLFLRRIGGGDVHAGGGPAGHHPHDPPARGATRRSSRRIEPRRRSSRRQSNPSHQPRTQDPLCSRLMP